MLHYYTIYHVYRDFRRLGFRNLSCETWSGSIATLYSKFGGAKKRERWFSQFSSSFSLLSIFWDLECVFLSGLRMLFRPCCQLHWTKVDHTQTQLRFSLFFYHSPRHFNVSSETRARDTHDVLWEYVTDNVMYVPCVKLPFLLFILKIGFVEKERERKLT